MLLDTRQSWRRWLLAISFLGAFCGSGELASFTLNAPEATVLAEDEEPPPPPPSDDVDDGNGNAYGYGHDQGYDDDGDDNDE